MSGLLLSFDVKGGGAWDTLIFSTLAVPIIRNVDRFYTDLDDTDLKLEGDSGIRLRYWVK